MEVRCDVCAGLAYQDQGRLQEAVAQFRSFSSFFLLHPTNASSEIVLAEDGGRGDMRLQGLVRECALLRLLQPGPQELLDCWQRAAELFPLSDVLHNELGNALLQVGEWERALRAYERALQLGSPVAQINRGHVLELLGEPEASRQAFSAAADAALNRSTRPDHLS